MNFGLQDNNIRSEIFRAIAIWISIFCFGSPGTVVYSVHGISSIWRDSFYNWATLTKIVQTVLSAFVKTHYVNRSCRCAPLLKKHNSFFLHCYCLSLVIIRKFIRVKVKSLKSKARIWRLMAVKWWLFRRRRGVMKSIFMTFYFKW